MRKIAMYSSLWGPVCACATCGSPPGFSKRDMVGDVIFETAEFKIACPTCRVPVSALTITEVVEQWNDTQVTEARNGDA